MHHCNFTSFSFEYLLTITVFESLVWGDVSLWGIGAKALSFVPCTPVFQQLQFLNVLRKLARTLFRGDGICLWTGTYLENLDHEKYHFWPQTKFVSIVELLWISSRHIVVALTLDCASKMNFYMVLRVTVFDLAASLNLMLSSLLSRKIRSDLDWPVCLLLVCVNMFSLLGKNINAAYSNTLNDVWIGKLV
jgi:hypothetical protein